MDTVECGATSICKPKGCRKIRARARSPNKGWYSCPADHTAATKFAAGRRGGCPRVTPKKFSWANLTQVFGDHGAVRYFGNRFEQPKVHAYCNIV